ncbi:MAG: 2-C-methyl-D-erythritol 4-phosphate cytidylyltransferase [Ruminiclostridium sp.]|nr:2-C-methyl-D-erythritol 4-phosphate cytidylyltransferase [Ruminiclostridium sp.]
MYFGGICAAGKGTRFGGDTPKQFLLLKGKPIVAYSVEEMLKCPQIGKIFVAVSKEYVDFCKDLFTDSKIEVIEGGKDRSDTVAIMAEKALTVGNADDVMITHDAARPIVSKETFLRCAKAAEEYGASGTAIPATDTVLQCREGFIYDAPPREEMFLAQTPQCFKLGLFKEVWESISEEEKRLATDACGMFFRAGRKVRIVEGEKSALKITVEEDIDRLSKP